MMVTFLARISAAVVVVAVTVAGAAGAWACFPLPLLTVQPQASGPVGAQVTVDGVDFGEGVSTEIRWNAVDGFLLGNGSSERFSVPVTIPETDDGTYAIVALSRLVDGSIGVKAVTTFQVVSDAAGKPPPSTASSLSEDAASSPSPTLSTAAAAGLALTGGAVFVSGVLGGALLSRRRSSTRPEGAAAESADRD